MKQLVSHIKKFVVRAYNKVKQALPDYSHKNSPKKYTQHQHAVVLMLKKKFKTTYRDVVDYLSEMPEICSFIGLNSIPHYTTAQKFFQRIGELRLLSLIDVYACRIIAVDSTGFASYSSRYYDKIANKSRKKRFQKMVLAIDTDKQLIQNVIPAIGYTYDTRYFIPIMKRLKAMYVIADKGFDSTANMLYAIRKKIKPVIEIRKDVRTGIRLRLKKLNKRFRKVYHQRSKAEAVMFVIKRKFGDTVYSRAYGLLRKEIILNAVCYNTYREILLAIMEVFYKDKSLTLC
jgi:hypothetical protein